MRASRDARNRRRPRRPDRPPRRSRTRTTKPQRCGFFVALFMRGRPWRVRRIGRRVRATGPPKWRHGRSVRAPGSRVVRSRSPGVRRGLRMAATRPPLRPRRRPCTGGGNPRAPSGASRRRTPMRYRATGAPCARSRARVAVTRAPRSATRARPRRSGAPRARTVAADAGTRTPRARVDGRRIRTRTMFRVRGWRLLLRWREANRASSPSFVDELLAGASAPRNHRRRPHSTRAASRTARRRTARRRSCRPGSGARPATRSRAR